MSDNWTSIRAAAAPETDGNEEAHKIEGCWVIRHTAAGLPDGRDHELTAEGSRRTRSS